jgi:hypothetical protein
MEGGREGGREGGKREGGREGGWVGGREGGRETREVKHLDLGLLVLVYNYQYCVYFLI